VLPERLHNLVVVLGDCGQFCAECFQLGFGGALVSAHGHELPVLEVVHTCGQDLGC
jgi:hypothetical protein